MKTEDFYMSHLLRNSVEPNIVFKVIIKFEVWNVVCQKVCVCVCVWVGGGGGSGSGEKGILFSELGRENIQDKDKDSKT